MLWKHRVEAERLRWRGRGGSGGAKSATRAVVFNGATCAVETDSNGRANGGGREEWARIGMDGGVKPGAGGGAASRRWWRNGMD